MDRSMRLLAGVLFFGALLALSAGAAFGQDDPVRPLPPTAWKLLTDAHGIQVGGAPGAEVRVQVVFDANCPYSAELYKWLHRYYAATAVRWVPVADLRADSAALAAAILASPSPVDALDEDFRRYHFGPDGGRGGYTLPPGATHQNLPAANLRLQQAWMRWGSLTPMLIVRTRRGAILMHGGIHGSARISELIQRAALPMKSYTATGKP